MNKNFRMKISFDDDNNERFLGPGVIELLRHLKSEPSLSKSAKEMKMSYSKATKIINRLEENLGKKILNRSHGGFERSGSSLTPFALYLIDEWDKLEKEINTYSTPIMEAFLNNIELYNSKP